MLLYICLIITLQYTISDIVQPQVSVRLTVPVLDLIDGVKNARLRRMFVQVEVLMDSGRKRHSGKLGFVRPYLEIGRKVRDEGELGFEAFGRFTSGRIQQEYKVRRNKVTFWLKMNNLITYFIK